MKNNEPVIIKIFGVSFRVFRLLGVLSCGVWLLPFLGVTELLTKQPRILAEYLSFIFLGVAFCSLSFAVFMNIFLGIGLFIATKFKWQINNPFKFSYSTFWLAIILGFIFVIALPSMPNINR